MGDARARRRAGPARALRPAPLLSSRDDVGIAIDGRYPEDRYHTLDSAELLWVIDLAVAAVINGLTDERAERRAALAKGLAEKRDRLRLTLDETRAALEAIEAEVRRLGIVC